MRLFLLRHGEAVGAEKVDGRDEARHLTREGVRSIEAIARALHAWGQCPEVIWSSRWTRAWQTAEIVARELALDGAIVAEPALEAPADLAPLLAQLRGASALASLMLVGHNPSLEDLAGGLIAPASRAALKLKKGGLAVIDVESPVGAGRGVLRGLWSPAEVTRVSGA